MFSILLMLRCSEVRLRIRTFAAGAGVAAVLALAGDVSLLAGQEGGTASLTGVVADELGGLLPGVTITAESAGGDVTRETVSDGAGRYVIAGLPAGAYDVEAALAGFQGRAATVEVGAAGARVDLTLGIAPLAETVTVTRSDQVLASVPNAVAVIGSDQIDFTERKSSLDEVLRGIPGLLVQNRRNYGLSGGIGLSIRAPQPRFGLRGLAIIQDGIPITTADGTTEPGNVDLGSVRRIEVIRGPSSVLYGNSAGGVISLFTEIDQARRLTVSPSTQFGSHGYQRHQVRVDGHNNSGTRFMGSHSRFRTDGWRQHSAAEIRQTNVVVRHAISSSTDVSGIFNHYDAPFAESPSFLTAAQAGDPRLPAEQLMNANPRQARPVRRGHRGGPELGRVGAAGAGRSDSRAPLRGHAARPGHGVGRAAEARRGGRRARHRPRPRGGRGAVGVPRRGRGGRHGDHVDDRGGRRLAGRRPDGVRVPAAVRRRGHGAPRRPPHRPAGGGAVGRSVRPGELGAAPPGDGDRRRPLRLLPVSRHGPEAGRRRPVRRADDGRGQPVGRRHGSRDFDAQPLRQLRHRLRDAHDGRALQHAGRRGGGFNQLLDPERLRSAEVGIRGLIEPARLQYDIAYYRARVLGALVPFQREDEQTFFDNAGESERNGVELSLDWQPVSRVRARLAYTRQDFTFAEFVLRGADYSGNLEPGAPPNRLFAGFDYAAPFGLRSSLTVRWVDEFFLTNANTAAASNWAYAVVDLRFGWDASWGDVGFRPFVGIDNLLSERYNSSAITNAFGRRYYEPSPGREIYAGITLGGGVR